MRRMLHTNVVYVGSYASWTKIIIATWKTTSKVHLLSVTPVSWNSTGSCRGVLFIWVYGCMNCYLKDNCVDVLRILKKIDQAAEGLAEIFHCENNLYYWQGT